MMYNIGHDVKMRKKKRKKNMERETATEDEEKIEVQLASVTLPQVHLKSTLLGCDFKVHFPGHLRHSFTSKSYFKII